MATDRATQRCLRGLRLLASQSLDGAAPKAITRYPGLQLFSYDWTPDSKQLSLTRGQTASDVVLISEFH